jgi:hypothetical protein
MIPFLPGTLVDINAQPPQTLKNFITGPGIEPFPVGVFYSQDECSPVVPGETIVEDRGTGTSNVEIPRGGRGKPYPDFCIHSYFLILYLISGLGQTEISIFTEPAVKTFVAVESLTGNLAGDVFDNLKHLFKINIPGIDDQFLVFDVGMGARIYDSEFQLVVDLAVQGFKEVFIDDHLQQCLVDPVFRPAGGCGFEISDTEVLLHQIRDSFQPDPQFFYLHLQLFFNEEGLNSSGKLPQKIVDECPTPLPALDFSLV